jgi:transcriptional regulator with XRE-family HTH domain
MANKIKHKAKKELEQIFKKIGSIGEIARLCNRHQQQVSNWLRMPKSLIHPDCVKILEKASALKVPEKYISKQFSNIQLPFFIPLIRRFKTLSNLVSELDSNVSSLSRVINGKTKCPVRLIKKICELSDGKITPYMLRPDIFSK